MQRKAGNRPSSGWSVVRRSWPELVLLLVGISLILYPILDNHLQHKRQLELLTHWDMQRHQHSTRSADNQLSVLGESISQQQEEAKLGSSSDTDLTLYEPLLLDGEQVIGTISIEKIQLREPVLARTTEKTLELGIGSVVEKVSPGEYGNFVLAGHRSRTYGKQFNRLDELGIGDLITIETVANEYVYVITSTFLVEPTDIFVLDQNPELRELTLITCEPIRNPTHRLIIRGELRQPGANQFVKEVKDE